MSNTDLPISHGAAFQWQGRIDEEENPARAQRWHQVMRHIDLMQVSRALVEQNQVDEPPRSAKQGVAIIGFAVDEGVRRNGGRVGAAGGPAHLRAALCNLPCWDETPLYDAGDIAFKAAPNLAPNVATDVALDESLSAQSEDALEQAQARLAEQVHRALRCGLLPLVMGGGHEMAWGSFQGLARALQAGQALTHLKEHHSVRSPRILIVNIDAHFDLRRAAQPNSGTPFLQIAQWCKVHNWPFLYRVLGVSRYANTPALFDRADALGVRYWLDSELQTASQVESVLSSLRSDMEQADCIYFTICLDALPASQAPGVSAPSTLGVPLVQIEALLQSIMQSGKVILADIAELNPVFDPQGMSAKVAARLLANMVYQNSKAL